MRLVTRTVALLALVALPVGSAAASDILINNVDAPGIGFNDPTPAAPVPGNPGTTIGAQRLATFARAAELWGAALPHDVDIVIQATFQPLPCDASSAVLGAAGTIQIFTEFSDSGNTWPLSWYPAALANQLVGADITPGPFDPGLLVEPYNDDIVAFFNGDIAGKPTCLGGASWYYGFDHNPAANQIDLLNVLMHELGHGLGFANYVTEDSGDGPLGLPDVYSAFTRDNTRGKYWNQMTNKERRASATNTGNLVWHGPTVSGRADEVLAGLPVMRVTAPASIAGDYEVQLASYGAPVTEAGVSGQVKAFNDGAGDGFDGCDGPDLTVAGKIALIKRGGCAFALKSAYAQVSGATGVIIMNNVATGLPPMGGDDLIPPTIPSVGISQADGNLLLAKLAGGVSVTLRTDRSLGLAGADDDGFVRLYAPNPVEPGSSLSHWDTVATPNLLMEPFLNADLNATASLDLTPDLLNDLGWDGAVHCPVGSDATSPTVVIGNCDTGLPNFFGPFTFPLRPLTKQGLTAGDIVSGCTLGDLYDGCLGKNAGDALTCVTRINDVLRSIGFISGAYAGAIQACVSAP